MTPENAYEDRRQRYADEARALNTRSARIGNARLATFLVGAGAFVAFAVGEPKNVLWAAAAGACGAVFLVLVAIHNKVDRVKRWAEEGRRVNEEALARLARDWSRVPEPRVALGEVPPFARDLDLFGHASLWKLLGTVSTPLGKSTLAGWLLEGAGPAEVASRQQAVRELAPRLDFRQELQMRARTMERLDPDCEPFLRWAEDEPWLAARPWIKWCARILAVLPTTLLVLSLNGISPHGLWMLAGLVNLGFDFVVARHIHPIFNRISSREGEFREYSRALELLVGDASIGRESRRLNELRERLAAGGLEAPREMKRLQSLVTTADARYSGTLHFLLAAFFVWDVHVLDRLERWQVRAGRSARAWLSALGEVEALSALAGLAFDEPEWSFPELAEADSPDGRRLAARGLGHPLIAPDARVSNDVTVGPPGSFLLITGSNMSGKSTLIRALGLNAVLAQAGGPVSAASLELPPVELGTSVLIEDSLEDGVSFFMAELKRVKAIVDLAAESRRRGRTLLYLMDEVLRGTNSFERQEAIRQVIVHLLGEGAIGAISTHDLMLAEIEELAAACRPVHFRETLESAPDKPMMSFDYKLRAGVATTRNALKLLELVGLGGLGEAVRTAREDRP